MVTIEMSKVEAEQVLDIAKRYTIILSESLSRDDLTMGQRKIIHGNLEIAKGIVSAVSKSL